VSISGNVPVNAFINAFITISSSSKTFIQTDQKPVDVAVLTIDLT
jgi:hypothetical protein